MIQVSAIEAQERFDSLLDTANKEPVNIISNKQSYVVISMSEYKRIARTRMLENIRDMQVEAKKNGLTEEILSEILNEG